MLHSRLASLRHALAGVVTMLRTQANAWIHALATVVAIAAGLALGISAADWKWLVLTIAAVWVAEAMNTAFERLCDVVSPKFSEGVRDAKDVAAGAVLLCAMCAVIMGALIFGPPLLRLIAP